MLRPSDDETTPTTTTPVIDGAIRAWTPALWAAYLEALLQDERKRTVN